MNRSQTCINSINICNIKQRQIKHNTNNKNNKKGPQKLKIYVNTIITDVVSLHCCVCNR